MVDDEETALHRARNTFEDSTITPKAAVILYEERARKAEEQGFMELAAYFRSLLESARKKLEGCE